MDFASVLRRFGGSGSFELPSLLDFTGEKRATVLQTLYRWNQKGWIIPIRCGLYTFPDDLAKNSLTAERAANQIQQGSYVTGRWLLSQLGLRAPLGDLLSQLGKIIDRSLDLRPASAPAQASRRDSLSCNGDSPCTWRNTREKCKGSANPIFSATSFTNMSVPIKSCAAWFIFWRKIYW